MNQIFLCSSICAKLVKLITMSLEKQIFNTHKTQISKTLLITCFLGIISLGKMFWTCRKEIAWLTFLKWSTASLYMEERKLHIWQMYGISHAVCTWRMWLVRACRLSWSFSQMRHKSTLALFMCTWKRQQTPSIKQIKWKWQFLLWYFLVPLYNVFFFKINVSHC